MRHHITGAANGAARRPAAAQAGRVKWMCRISTSGCNLGGPRSIVGVGLALPLRTDGPLQRTMADTAMGGGQAHPLQKTIMTYDPRIHHRRSIRLRGYDYAGGGAYFVTICTQGKVPVFGQVVEGEMLVNDAGRLVQKIWEELAQRFETLVLDAFQVMPNHMHGVFVLPGPGLHPALAEATGAPVIQPGAINPPRDGRRRARSTLAMVDSTIEGRASPTKLTSMGDVVGAFKFISTIAVNKLLSRVGTKLLHENFYEHIVRDVHELEIIRDYIIHNPQRWEEDPDNPESPASED